MQVILKKVYISDKDNFAKWWRDKDLIALTSGVFKNISDQEINNFFNDMINETDGWHFMINADNKAIGHISLLKSDEGWYETQIMIGNKDYWSKGYGSKAIKKLIAFAKTKNITKIFLEVRPDNLRAIKAYEKCGFSQKQIIEYPQNKNLPKTLRMELDAI